MTFTLAWYELVLLCVGCATMALMFGVLLGCCLAMAGQMDDDVTHGYPGNVWFVDSGATSTDKGTDRHGQNPDEPFETITDAISHCTANDGDVIRVLPRQDADELQEQDEME